MIEIGVALIVGIRNAFKLGEVVRRRSADCHCPYEPSSTIIDRVFRAVGIYNIFRISTVVRGKTLLTVLSVETSPLVAKTVRFHRYACVKV